MSLQVCYSLSLIIVLTVDAETVALYQFDDNFTDTAGRSPDLVVAGGEPSFSDSVEWMATPSGKSVEFKALGDELPDEDLVTSGTDALTVEWKQRVRKNLAYSVRGVPLMNLEQNFESRLRYYQHRWDLPVVGSVDVNNVEVASAEQLESFLPKRCLGIDGHGL